jgi:hypothetical protein
VAATPRVRRLTLAALIVAAVAALAGCGGGGRKAIVAQHSPSQVHLSAFEKAEYQGASCVFKDVWGSGGAGANLGPAINDCTAQVVTARSRGGGVAAVEAADFALRGIQKEASCMSRYGTAGPQCVPTKRKFALGRGVTQNSGGSSSSRTYVLSPLFPAKPLVEPHEISLLSDDHVKARNWSGWGTDVARADATYYSCPTGSPCSPIHGTLVLDKRRTSPCGPPGQRLSVYTRGRVFGPEGETLATLGLGTDYAGCQ